METDEIAHLKTEIARLNKVIEVLLKYNDLLSAQIALAKTRNSDPNAGIAIAEIIKGNPNVGNAVHEIRNGNSNVTDALQENIKGNPKLGTALPKTDNGNPNAGDDTPEISKGNTNVPKALPQIVNPSPNMIVALSEILKDTGFNKVRYDAIRNTVLLLIHFHNKNTGDHAELRKLTGLSQFGMAKFIGSLKKRNLIIRTGWQQFDITTTGEASIRKAWEQTDGR